MEIIGCIGGSRFASIRWFRKYPRYNAGKFSRLASRASNVNLNIRIQTSVRVHRSRGRSIKGGKETKRYAYTLDSLNKQFDDFAAVLSKSSQFPSCFRHSFFSSIFLFFFSPSFFFTVISRRGFIRFANQIDRGNRTLDAREIRELRVLR